MSNASEIRAAPSEMKCYLTHGQALELFPVILGTNTVSSPPVPLGRCDPTQTQTQTPTWVGLCQVGIKSAARNTWAAAWDQSQIRATQPKLSPTSMDISEICQSYTSKTPQVFLVAGQNMCPIP